MKKCFSKFEITRMIILFSTFLDKPSILFEKRTTHFEREMNDDSSYDGGRFDTGAMGDLDPMVNYFYFGIIIKI